MDGSKFRASNSKRSNFNQKKIQRHLKYIDEKINHYLSELDSNDQDEADIHVPTAEEIRQRIEELKSRKAKYLACLLYTSSLICPVTLEAPQTANKRA